MRRMFIVNPVARGALPDLGERIRARFADTEVALTRAPGDAGRLAAEAMARALPPELLAACGGDGTVREVAQAAGGRAAVGIVPLGTVNQVAAALGIPENVDRALDVLAAGREAVVYPGGCRFDGEAEARLFFIGVSAGPDADAVHGVSPALKRRFGRYAYVAAFLSALRGMRPNAIRCQGGGAAFFASQAVAVKSTRYGGIFQYSRDLALTKPGVDVATAAGGRLAVAGFFLRGLLRLPPRALLSLPPGERFAMELAGPGGFQIDGDAVSARRADIFAVAGPIRFLAGRF